MRSFNSCLSIAAICIAGLITSGARADVTLTTLVSFNGNNGISPNTGLVLATNGLMYGMASGGTNGGYGTAFVVSTNSTFTNLVSLSATNGFQAGKLIQARDGFFYGTSPDGGTNNNGAIFRMTKDGALTLIASIGPDSSFPQAELAQGNDGNFYGTTTFGGHNGHGLIFRMSPDGTLTNLVYFEGLNGANPWFGALVLGRDGSFYGTTSAGGLYNLGTVFRLDPDGTLTNLLYFDGTNGAQPRYGLTLAADGNFYGTTWGGTTTNDFGNTFKMTPDGTLTVLALFNGTNGVIPRKLIQGTDGNFFGLTGLGGTGFNGSLLSGKGTIFEMTPDGTLTTLLAFNGTNGLDPFGGLTQAGDGDFYGTTYQGGTSGAGTIFKLHVPGADSPKIQSINKSNLVTTLTWNALLGRSYQLQFTTNLNPVAWTDTGSLVIGTNPPAIAVDSNSSDPQRFYRLKLIP